MLPSSHESTWFLKIAGFDACVCVSGGKENLFFPLQPGKKRWAPLILFWWLSGKQERHIQPRCEILSETCRDTGNALNYADMQNFNEHHTKDKRAAPIVAAQKKNCTVGTWEGSKWRVAGNAPAAAAARRRRVSRGICDTVSKAEQPRESGRRVSSLRQMIPALLLH